MFLDPFHGSSHIILTFIIYIGALAERLFIGGLVFGNLPHPIPKSGGFESDHPVLPNLWDLATVYKDGDGFASFRVFGEKLLRLLKVCC